jgi:Fur family peroxide stress response transcriptional regulator
MQDDSFTQSLIERLKEVGLRVTPQRLAIYRALVASDRHPTAQGLFEQLQPTLPSLSQATVYNNLQALVESGLIQEVGEAGDGSIHYDANQAPHINLVCVRCHRIEDFDYALEQVAQRVIAQSGYQVQGMSIAYYGVCPRCQ